MHIAFSEIMHKWLYDENYGYYKFHKNVGFKGDFYTSVSISKFFGASIARYILKLLDDKRLFLPLNIIEIGSNNGNLISDIAQFLLSFNEGIFCEFEFCSIERMSHLHILQKENFKNKIHKINKTKHLYIFKTLLDFANESFAKNNTFFISNELFDSFICDVIINDKMLFFECDSLDFALNANKKNDILNCDLTNFIFAPIAPKVQDFIDTFDIKNNEVPLYLYDFLRELSNVKNFIFLSFDYGDFDFRGLNLRIYKNHNVYNFYEELQNKNLGNFYQTCDITYDVDFSLIKKIAKSLKLEVSFIKTQGTFLINDCEILDIFEIFSANFSDNLKIKHSSNISNLIMPTKMGERFKVIEICSTK